MARILCATDLSDRSDHALIESDAIARAQDARLGVCHVVQSGYFRPSDEPFEAPRPASAVSVRDLERAALETLRSRVARATRRGDGEVDLFVDFWQPNVEIVKRAESYGASLVVVGSHDSSGLARALLGSVAERVARAAPCPVLISRSFDGEPVVLAATDFSDVSEPVIGAARREARRRQARLVVAHVSGRAGAPPRAREEVRASIEAALARHGAAGEAVVLDGAPAAAIFACAESVGADLVVVGTRAKAGLERLVLGSVAEEVIRTVSCSVMVVRPPRRSTTEDR